MLLFRKKHTAFCKIKILFVKISAEQFQRSNPLSAPRLEMNVGLGSTSYINIHKLKREVDSLKQRQQEIQLFNQVYKNHRLTNPKLFRIKTKI